MTDPRLRSYVALLLLVWAASSAPHALNEPRQPVESFATDPSYGHGTQGPLRRSSSDVVARLRADRGAAALSVDGVVVRETLHLNGRALYVLRARNGRAEELLVRLRADPRFDLAAPVFTDGGALVVPSDEIVVKVRRPGLDLSAVPDASAFEQPRAVPGAVGEYVLRLRDAKGRDAISHAGALAASDYFEWVQPNFLQSYRTQSIPNDPLFANQWHLLNAGQNSGRPDADVKATAAWDIESGKSTVVIAVLDVGIELGHEDLAANIFVNPGEIPANGMDDDANGYVDDVSGWDFASGDNSPSPGGNAHGTAVAGVAAARGGNGLGISGVCQTCRILPVKVTEGEAFASDVAIAEAIRYAGRMADIVNISWTGGVASAVIEASLQDAITNGRRGLGAIVLGASGNANPQFFDSGQHLQAGTYTFRFRYTKDSSGTAGADGTWLQWVQFPGELPTTFENGLPPGWTTGGDAPWFVDSDAAHADEGRCYTSSLRSGRIGDGGQSFIEVTKTVPAGLIITRQWISAGPGDFFDFTANGQLLPPGLRLGGYPTDTLPVSYPAAYPQVAAVGATSNVDCRASYSQFGPQLQFVAPGLGNPSDAQPDATDLTGRLGYFSGNYTSRFVGTSASTAIASGVAALVLSRNRALTREEVLQILRDTADKVGPELYAQERNERYGYGRLNALKAVQATPPTLHTFNPSAVAATTATVTAVVNPAGLPTTAVFEFGTTAAYGGQVAASPVGSGHSPVTVSGALSGLACSTTYHYRVVTEDPGGTKVGEDRVVRTLECPGVTNLFLQHDATGCIVAWHMNRVSLLSQDFLVPACVADSDWRVAGSADFDADGRPDLAFQHLTNGGILVWLMNGIVIKEQRFLSPSSVSDPNWRIAAIGDFDADGQPDLIIQNIADGRKLAWLLNGTVLKAQVFLNPGAVADPNWRIVGSGDIDLDSKPDLFFQNIANGLMVQWLMDGVSLRRQDFVNPAQVDPAWLVSAIVDVNNDTRPDMILQNINDGRMVAWPLNGPNLIGQLLLNPFQVSDPRWRIVGPR